MNFKKNHGPFDSATRAAEECEDCNHIMMEAGETYEDNEYWAGEFIDE